jgi:peptidyl-prolyl cis-trans isomerase C
MTVVIDTTKKAGAQALAKAPLVSARTAAPPVVSVNGTLIPPKAIAAEMQHHPALKPLAAWQEAARALAIRELLLQEAERLAIRPQPQTDEAGRRETDEEALLRALAEQEIKTPEADTEICRRYYERNLARFRSPDIYEAAHILFAARSDELVAFAEAQQQGEVVLAELRLHPERFAALAVAYSACPSGAQGGNLGQIVAGQTTAEFEEALLALARGCITAALVPTRYGLHIIRLDRKIDGRQLPFAAVAAQIAEYLRESVSRRASAQYVARLAAGARIEGIDLTSAEAMRVH